MPCEVQIMPGVWCGQKVVKQWYWPGGPSLKICRNHDKEMMRERQNCKVCQETIRTKPHGGGDE